LSGIKEVLQKTREKVIRQCGSAIFIFGEADGNSTNAQSGVLEEFEIACKQDYLIQTAKELLHAQSKLLQDRNDQNQPD